MNRLDEWLKERARREDCPIPQGFDGRMDAILEGLPEGRRKPGPRRLRRWAVAGVLAAALCVGGVAAAGIFAALVGVATPLNGFNMSEAENLLLYGAEQGLHVSGLLVCGVLVAALGAVMDVSMSIASALWELRVNNPDLPARDLFRSGMNIGKDAMGTMANTLILAFAGSSLNTLLLVRVYDIPFAQLVNTDFICVEILQSVAGSMGILLTVPLVTAVSAKLMTADRVQHSTKTPQRI